MSTKKFWNQNTKLLRKKRRKNIKNNKLKEDETHLEREAYIKTLTELYEREKESRCYFQIERDKLTKMRDVEKQRLDEYKLKLLETEEKLNKFEEFHHLEIQNLKKKIKYLIGERDIKIGELKLEYMIENKVDFKINYAKENLYLNKIRECVKNLNEDRLNLDEAIKNLKIENENKISHLKNESAENVLSIQKTCELRFNNERENYSLMARNNIHEITELKNTQIAQMKQFKDKIFEDMRKYYKDLVQNLMNNIDKMEKKIVSLERNFKEKEVKFQKTQIECQNLTLENQKLKKDNNSLGLKADLYIKTKRIFKKRNTEYADLMKNYHNMDLKYEALLKIYENLKGENKLLESYIENLVEKFKVNFETLNFISFNKKKNDTELNSL